MCTVTLIARRNGYALGMNRDEKLARVKGLPPKRRIVDGRQVVCPSEPGGGTWIGLNDSGATFALINWYSITARVGKNPVSRGDVVNAVSAADSIASAASALAALPLKQINPFRLIAVFPLTKEVIEWRWDSTKLTHRNCGWQTQQWVSSGFDEALAQKIRGETFREAMNQKKIGTLGWLRRLHQSHKPEQGPFSICMHREDAATVSYSEVIVSRPSVMMRHYSDSPCTSSPLHTLKIQLASR